MSTASITYLDNNATTAVAPEVLEAMLPYLSDYYGNPSSMYRFAGRAEAGLARAREQVAAILGASPEEILFTACGTESDNTAINSALASQPDKRHIITTKVEHPAVLATVQHLENNGYRVTWLGVDEKGRLDLEEVRAAFRPDTALIAVMFANNETGNIYPMAEIAAMAAERGVQMLTDAVQAVGKVPFKLSDLPVNFLALSGHKLHAPKGVGALYVRRGTPFRPFMLGGHQERGRRAGTENVASIVALGAACELAGKHIQDENTRVKALRDKLEKGLLERVSLAMVNGDTQNRLPNTLNIAFKNIEGESILLLLDRLGICASSGSACTSGSLEPSHVLRAMGVPFTHVHGSLRLSLSRYNTEKDIDLVLKELPVIVEHLRSISPYREDQEPRACAARF